MAPDETTCLPSLAYRGHCKESTCPSSVSIQLLMLVGGMVSDNLWGEVLTSG